MFTTRTARGGALIVRGAGRDGAAGGVRSEAGDALQPAQRAKLAAEPALRAQLAALGH